MERLGKRVSLEEAFRRLNAGGRIAETVMRCGDF